jgi:hypothetical protein
MAISSCGITSERMQPTSVVPPNINTLPKELLAQIFSNLSKYDLQAVVGANRGMGSGVKAALNFNQPTSIKSFILSLFKRLNGETFSLQKESLIGIAENITPQNFDTLRLLKEYIWGVKVQLAGVIKTLDEGTANDLRDHIQPPDFLEDVFRLATFERQIDAANLIADPDSRGVALQDIYKALIQAGNIDRAIEVASSIPDKYARLSALRDISQALAQAGNIDRALEVAMSIPNESAKSWYALRDISKALVQADNIDRALEVAMSIPNKSAVNWPALQDICGALIQAGNTEGALQVAMLIPNEDARWNALGDIYEPLT